MIIRLCYALLALFALVSAQTTVTTTNAAGATIVQVVSTDQVLGPQTSIISTLPAATPTTLTQAPPQQGQQGQVGTRTSTTSHPVGGPTPYTYLTTVNGQTEWIVDTFLPTSGPAFTSKAIPATGSIMDYDAFISKYGVSPLDIHASASTLHISISLSILSTLLAAFILVV
ncbi:hypothetical protein D9611_001684 [Ephemerocybe angulata]|uniref:Uncharacterized protein n=1 Tax=Ephemerocybe angulata TaxID=980116 RepID=A0A8H5CJH6_9AGAR|nr:hypothetical protein D9611_001684 [Tulosesus angulatus]